jgi:hypothetical protein
MPVNPIPVGAEDVDGVMGTNVTDDGVEVIAGVPSTMITV